MALRDMLAHQNKAAAIERRRLFVVQVTKGPRGTKGARVSTRIALPGRYVVLMPESTHVGVSRKIEDRAELARRNGATLVAKEFFPPLELPGATRF